VCDIRNLSYYLDKGLDITKIHKVITFDQRPWMRDYITFNTDRRKEAKNEFEKDFYKLMSNSCFGKTMENLRERVNMRFFSSNSHWGKNRTVHLRTIERNCASPLYKGHAIYNNDLAAIHLKRKSVCLNKPIYAGMCILDLSKLHMFHYHYDVIKAQYGANARLLFTDTDSLCYQIKCDDFYKDMKRWSFNLQVYFLNSRFAQLIDLKEKGKPMIQDRTIYEDAHIFAPNLNAMGLMSTRDYENYRILFDLMETFVSPPDLMIYLRASVPKLVSQIQKRGRDYEEAIRLDYLNRLNERYEAWISTYTKGELLIIDVDDLEFGDNKEDLGKIIEAIDAKLHGLFEQAK
jgi:deoxyadenosine/deoxycytidine kinase